MKKFLSLLAVMIIAATSFAQVEDVTLTVLGTGRTEDEATNTALRSAIEQSFGTFVSANTSILNDQMVKDEIVSISKGNIKSYDKLSVSSLPNGQIGVSIRATVSVNKLISYAKSKGSRAEFAGQAYAANVKLIKLKAESTKKALNAMLSQMDILSKDLFDFELSIGEPVIGELGTDYYLPKGHMNYKYSRSEGYIIPLNVAVYANIASTNFANIYFNTLKSLNLSEEEIRLCQNNRIEVSRVLGFGEYRKDGESGAVYLMDISHANRGQSDMNIILPLSCAENMTFHKKIQAIYIKSLRRFKIQEIGTRNAFEWKLWRKETSSSRDILTLRYPYVPKEDVCVLYSSIDKKYIVNSYTYAGGSGTPSAITYGRLYFRNFEDFIVPIRKEPIKLTAAQKKAQKNGTFTGKTYNEILGKQKKLLSLDLCLYKRGGLDSFGGYELREVSAPQNKE